MAGRGRARWCCLCLWGGWRTQTGTSGLARSSAGVTEEGSWPTASGEHAEGYQRSDAIEVKLSDSDGSRTDCRWKCTKCSWWHIWHFELSLFTIHTLLSMVSRSRVRSSMAASQFCMRISEASFPHRELKAFRSVEGTWTKQQIQQNPIGNQVRNKCWNWNFLKSYRFILTRTRKK